MTLIKWSGQAAPAPTVRRRRQPVPAENTHLLLSDHRDRRVHRVQALAQAVRVHDGGLRAEDGQGGALGRGGRGGAGVRRGAHRFGRLASINWSESHGGCRQVPWQPRPAGRSAGAIRAGGAVAGSGTGRQVYNNQTTKHLASQLVQGRDAPFEIRRREGGGGL